MKVSKPPVRWVKAYWEEGDHTYFFETDEDGWVLRQVVLQGPDRIPTVAASLVEWPRGLAAGQAYLAKYGLLAEKPITKWDFPHVKITHAKFEKTWALARSELDAKRPSSVERAARPRKPRRPATSPQKRRLRPNSRSSRSA